MPDVIDSLVVLLSLDASKFTQGQKDAVVNLRKTQEEAERVGKNIEASGKKGAEFFTQMRDSALGLFTVLLGGKELAGFAREATNSASALGRAAHDIGMSSKDLGAFNAMIYQAGGGAEDATAAFTNLGLALARARLGFKPSDDLLYTLGMLGQYGASTQSTPGEIYKDFNRWSQGKSPGDVVAFGNFLGYSRPMIDLAEKPTAEFQKRLAEGQKAALPPETIKQLTEMQRSWRALGGEIYKVSAIALGDFGHASDKVADDLTKWGQDNEHLAVTIDKVGIALLALAGGKGMTALLGRVIPGLTTVSTLLGFILRASVVLGLPGLTAGDTPGGWKDMTPAERAAAAAKAQADADAFNKLSPADQAKAIAAARAKDDAAASAAGASWWHNLFHGGSAPGASPVGPQSSSTSSGTAGVSPGVLAMFRKLEGSGDREVSYKGAVGRYQIEPSTAAKLKGIGFPDPAHPNDPVNIEWLKNPVNNTRAARALLAQLMGQFNDLSAVAIGYHSGPDVAESWLRSGRKDSVLGPQGRAYLQNERALAAIRHLDAAAAATGPQSSNITHNTSQMALNGGVHIHTRATDSAGIARAIYDDLVMQANTGLA